ncbi:MAG: hypothetical protein IKO68_10570 [Oscillospiraceae bacterium]|nr:hypothetical protein [Oscillospiraceae bacterium]
MKRAITILLALLMVLSLAACGDWPKDASGVASKNTPTTENTFDAKDAFKSKMQADVVVYSMFNYADVKLTTLDLTTIDADGDTYTGKGKVTVLDDYGDKYVGKVTGVYKLDGETFTKISLDIETPKKQ